MPKWMCAGRARWALGLALAYALVVLVTPALHDGGDCFGDSPEHCAACLANPPAMQLAPQEALLAPDLSRAERIEPVVEACAGALLPADAPGRSPPA
ncbi:MAG: hypothetical protein ACM3PV_11115 [Betaproteobacteria bacterium]